MKRQQPADPSPYSHSTGNIKDLPKDVLAEIGAVALACHDLEAAIDAMLAACMGHNWLFQWFSQKKTPILEKIDLLIRALDHTHMAPCTLEEFKEFLKSSKIYIDYRNTVIHCRIINMPTGIGENTSNKNNPWEILLTIDSLERLYNFLVAIKNEADSASKLIDATNELAFIGSDDPNRALLEPKVRELSDQFQAKRSNRRSLPLIPEFPSEPELLAAVNLWQQNQVAAQMGWFVPWEQPIRPPHRIAVFDSPSPGYVPMPPPDEKKD